MVFDAVSWSDVSWSEVSWDAVSWSDVSGRPAPFSPFGGLELVYPGQGDVCPRESE